MIEVIKTYPLATIISVKNNKPLITHLPLIYNNKGKLVGHIDIYNPQAELLKNNTNVTVIFSGPQCYISPSIYTTSQLPTWNYIKVHIKGKVKTIKNKEALKNSLIDMTAFLEQPHYKYVLEPTDPKLEKSINYIKLFEIEITNWEGKFKLSQDKKPKDIANAKTELVRANQESVKQFLDKVFK